jgi:S-adenosylmethionine synthetase
MSPRSYLFTSESVSEGHPDKVADQISDAILDAMLAEDPMSRVACETLVTTGLAFIAGEVTTKAYAPVSDIVRQTIKEIGYNDHSMGFDWETCGVIVSLDKQSPDISQGVSEGEGLYAEQGAGDQGLMFGYACNDTKELMPMPIVLAHRLTNKLTEYRKSGAVDFLRPDSKSQVTVRYDDMKPAYVDTIVVSSQHGPEVDYEDLKSTIIENVVKPTIPAELMTDETRLFINPTGRFVQGGPHADCGLTGRKIIVDTYGGVGSHGGGAFSGKDPTKVDRSASYMARYIAKNLVAAGAVDRCEVQLAYAIGFAEPVSIMVNGFGTSKVEHDKVLMAVRELFPLSPAGIIKHLDLRRPIYRKTASGGHFGRNDPDFTWERTDKAQDIKKILSL